MFDYKLIIILVWQEGEGFMLICHHDDMLTDNVINVHRGDQSKKKPVQSGDGVTLKESQAAKEPVCVCCGRTETQAIS